MIKRSTQGVAMFAIAAVMLLCGSAESAQDQKPKIAPICKQCHEPDEKRLQGTLAGVSQKAETIQVQVGPATWIVKYGDDIKLKGVDHILRIPKEKEIAVTIEDRGGSLYATAVAMKPPAKVPAEKLIQVDALAKLVAEGPEKGNFVLIDSRPAPRYNEGHIPGAILLYDAEFDKQKDRLPREQDKLLIFYCGGDT